MASISRAHRNLKNELNPQGLTYPISDVVSLFCRANDFSVTELYVSDLRRCSAGFVRNYSALLAVLAAWTDSTASQIADHLRRSQSDVSFRIRRLDDFLLVADPAVSARVEAARRCMTSADPFAAAEGIDGQRKAVEEAEAERQLAAAVALDRYRRLTHKEVDQRAMEVPELSWERRAAHRQTVAFAAAFYRAHGAFAVYPSLTAPDSVPAGEWCFRPSVMLG